MCVEVLHLCTVLYPSVRLFVENFAVVIILSEIAKVTALS